MKAKQNMLSRLRTFFSPKAQYDGAKPSVRRAARWDFTAASASASTTPYIPALRNRARAAVRNDPWASNAINELVSNLIGTGIVARPATKNAELKAEIIELWNDWTEQCDSAGVLDFYGMQALVARAYYESGEVFIRIRQRYPEEMDVPLQLQIIEADQVSLINEDLENGFYIRSGIEYNPIGNRVAYHVYNKHPGDTNNAKIKLETVRVPADQMLHIFKPLRPGQDRGVPFLSQVLGKLESLNKFDDALLFRQELANLFVAFVRQNPEFADTDITETEAPITATEEVMLEPGATRVLEPGEDVQFSTPPDSGSAYPDFMKQQLMAVSAGIGLPYEILSGNYGNISDRTMRVIMNNFKRRLEQDQWTVIIAQFLKPVRKAFIENAILADKLSLNQKKEALKTYWTPQAHAYIQPVTDVNAQILAINAGLKSRAEVIRERGYDIEEVDAERAEDRDALSGA